MFVATKSSRLRENADKSFECVVFESRKSKKKKEEEGRKLLVNKNVQEVNDEDMRKFRYDIMKFGATGFDKAKKQETKVAVAVALGAKPAKKAYRNYKEILSEKKSEKEQREKLKELMKKGKADPGAIYRKANMKSKEKKKKDMRGLLNVYGKVNRDMRRAAKRDQAKR